jgi:hypothetical protein
MVSMLLGTHRSRFPRPRSGRPAFLSQQKAIPFLAVPFSSDFPRRYTLSASGCGQSHNDMTKRVADYARNIGVDEGYLAF